MKRTSIAALTITAATTALAANPWVWVGKSTWGLDVYYNPQTVSTYNGSVSVSTTGLYGGSQITTEFINCNNWTHNTIMSTGRPSPDEYMPPNTAINTLAEKVCK